MHIGKPLYWDQACRELAAADPVLAKLIAAYPQISLEGRGDAFQTLARSIVGQQISVKAADAVWRRVIAYLETMQSQRVLLAEVDALRACGLSGRKVEYLKSLAQHEVQGRLNPDDWVEWDDEAIIHELTSIRGIGRWTVEMFLIFHLMRANVLPLDDIGLIKAIALHYHNGERLSKAEIRKLAECWQPWCSVATWYFWRSLEPIPVSY